MTTFASISHSHPAACFTFENTFQVGDLVKRCLDCDELFHNSCWGTAGKCPACKAVTTGIPIRVFKGGKVFREASGGEVNNG